MPFEYAHRNFYRAAQSGLDAELLWPSDSAPSPRAVPAAELVERLMPIAEQGLVAGGVDREEIRQLLPIVERRARTGRTGAQWQRRVLDRLERRLPRREALNALLLRYMERSASDAPVHTWPLDG
jgi:gamma-glutamyl:cysteine ligase YbdK (ATP-grasp superfamily)